ncbi:hypothetical protein WN943_004638 [Citrus x changshan-huyou]
MALQPHHSIREKAERMKRSDPAEKEAATREKEERDKQAQWNKKEAHFHNEEAWRVAQSGGGGAHPGYKIWGSHSQARDDSNATTTATAPAPALGLKVVTPRPRRELGMPLLPGIHVSPGALINIIPSKIKRGLKGRVRKMLGSQRNQRMTRETVFSAAVLLLVPLAT